ncbi:hypothetical protein [Flavobacterium selenitireducens]|uniref:hypothetical protein n=1 Tax=Flavobacterium selenitireducens TaxID=2722704 RepID=UPI00168AA461|nr:hypothetical protein [Flavobacterium selenitireducens]MBD3582987.1 hypothetical protein [Flavobacterium selenitireducens]
MTEKLRCDLGRWIAVLSLLSTIFISRALWFANSSFPMIPAFEKFGVVSDDVGNACVYMMLACAFVFGITANRWVLLPMLAAFAILVQADINRLQPTYYIFVLILCCHAFPKRRALLLILLFSGIYFWSGVHKFNSYFLEKWLLGMDKRIPFAPAFARVAFTYAVPAIEALAGLMLLHLRLRKIGAATLVLMHLLIIATLVREHGGVNVIPLNLVMILTLLLVIFASDTHVVASFDKKAAFLTLVVWLLPVLNLFGYYDHFPSFSIMSGKPEYATVYFPDEATSQTVPEAARPFVRHFEGRHYIQLSEWAGHAKKIMIYPQERVYASLKDSLTRHMSDAKKAKTELHLYKP